MSEQDEVSRCKLCGEPMPEGEEMFFYHGYSGDCPKPPLPKAAAPPPQTEPLSRGADYKSDLYADLADEDYAIGYLKKCFADSVEASHQGVRDVISASLIAGGSKGIGSPPSPDERTEQIRAKLQTKEGCWVADSGDVWYLLKRLDAAQTVVLAHDFVLHPAMDVFDEATKTHFPIRSPKTMVTTVGEHAEIWEVHEEDVTQFWYCYETESRTWACNLFKEVEP